MNTFQWKSKGYITTSLNYNALNTMLKNRNISFFFFFPPFANPFTYNEVIGFMNYFMVKPEADVKITKELSGMNVFIHLYVYRKSTCLHIYINFKHTFTHAYVTQRPGYFHF